MTVTIWSLTVLIFFTLSSRQEYYSLPALPALALLLGGTLPSPPNPRTENREQNLRSCPSLCSTAASSSPSPSSSPPPASSSPSPPPPANPAPTSPPSSPRTPTLYNLSLGHIFDLTGAAMAFFRGPLIAVAAGMLTLGLASYHLRRRSQTYAANLTLAAGMIIVLLAAHTGYARFNPILGSEPLAPPSSPKNQPGNRPILLDGELTSGSTLLFYTRQPVHLVNGRVNGPWFGSFYPDAPALFDTESTLRQLWSGPRRLYLLTYHPAQRTRDLTPYAPVKTLATAGGKTILTNR